LAALDSLFMERKTEGEITRATLQRLAQHDASGGGGGGGGGEGVTQSMASLVREYEQTLAVVNTQLADRVMNNYSLFVQGMGKIHELGLDLQQSAVICKNGRRVIQQVCLLINRIVLIFNRLSVHSIL
jgi:hypothetical protein